MVEWGIKIYLVHQMCDNIVSSGYTRNFLLVALCLAFSMYGLLLKTLSLILVVGKALEVGHFPTWA